MECKVEVQLQPNESKRKRKAEGMKELGKLLSEKLKRNGERGGDRERWVRFPFRLPEWEFSRSQLIFELPKFRFYEHRWKLNKVKFVSQEVIREYHPICPQFSESQRFQCSLYQRKVATKRKRWRDKVKRRKETKEMAK